MTRFPDMREALRPIIGSEKFDEQSARKALQPLVDEKFLTWGRDDLWTVTFCCEFLWQLSSSVARLEDDETTTAHTCSHGHEDDRLEAKYDRGMFAYTRLDILTIDGGIRVRLSYDNPRDVKGTALLSARRFGIIASRVLMYIRDEINRDRGRDMVTLEGVGIAKDIFVESEFELRRILAKDEVDAANDTRRNCPNRHGEYCSPMNPGCACHRGGKCTEAKLPEDLERYDAEKFVPSDTISHGSGLRSLRIERRENVPMMNFVKERLCRQS